MTSNFQTSVYISPMQPLSPALSNDTPPPAAKEPSLATFVATGDYVGLVVVMLALLCFIFFVIIVVSLVMRHHITRIRVRLIWRTIVKSTAVKYVSILALTLFIVGILSMMSGNSAWANTNPKEEFPSLGISASTDQSSFNLAQNSEVAPGVYRIYHQKSNRMISGVPNALNNVYLRRRSFRPETLYFLEKNPDNTFSFYSLYSDKYITAALNDADSNLNSPLMLEQPTSPERFHWHLHNNPSTHTWAFSLGTTDLAPYAYVTGSTSSGMDYLVRINSPSVSPGNDKYLWVLDEVLLEGTAQLSGIAQTQETVTCTALISSYKAGNLIFRWYTYSTDPLDKTLICESEPTNQTSSTLVVPQSSANKHLICEVSSTRYRGTITTTDILIKNTQLSGEASIVGSYIYQGAELTCQVSGLPHDALPSFSWYRGDTYQACTELIGTSPTYKPQKEDLNSFITCIVRDSSSTYTGELYAYGDQVTARLSLTAPLSTQGLINEQGDITIEPIVITNCSSCPIEIYALSTTKNPLIDHLECTITSQNSLLYKGPFLPSMPLSKYIVLNEAENASITLTGRSTITEPLAQTVTQQRFVELGSVTFCARI